MLNEEKVILMTQMASYEENEGKKNMAIGRYFRSDYIAIQVLSPFCARRSRMESALRCLCSMILRISCRIFTRWT